MGVENYLVSSAVEGILAQRLVRRICPACRAEEDPEKRLLVEMDLGGEVDGDIVLYRGKGCSECNHTGYRGRIGIFELMVMNDELRRLVLENRPLADLREAAVGAGMVTLRHDGWRKALAGETTIEEVMRVTQEEE